MMEKMRGRLLRESVFFPKWARLIITHTDRCSSTSLKCAELPPLFKEPNFDLREMKWHTSHPRNAKFILAF